MINTPILITGLPRSGTSLVAGCISMCGAWGGDLVPANRWNRKGFFENPTLKDSFNKKILSDAGFCDVGVNGLPPKDYNFEDAFVIGYDVREEVKAQGYKEDKPWFFKDAKTTLTWPVWNRAFPKAKWILTSRSKISIINSCKNTLFMQNQNLTDDQWLEWHKQYEEHLFCIPKHVNHRFIDTDLLASGNLTQLGEALDFVGLKYNKEVKNFIDRKLWHY